MIDGLFAAIDLYCERGGPGWWAEPLNAFTNLAFILVAAWLLRRQYPADVWPEVRLLALLIGLIGVCSGYFHFSGQRIGMWLDVASIALFIMVFLHRYLVRLAHWSGARAALAVVVFIAAERGFEFLWKLAPVWRLNGSETYIVPWLCLVWLALAARRLAPSAFGALMLAALLFPLSFALRSLDMALCVVWPVGTHFAWHLLNAIVLGLCVVGLAKGCRDRFQGCR